MNARTPRTRARAIPTTTTPTAAIPTTEEDIRLRMLNSFMSCPHRDTDAIQKIHKELRDQDPVFYAHLACWYNKNGDVRDHKEVMAGMLITDSYQPNREVGLALFREHVPFMKARILGFIRGKEVKIRIKTGTKKKVGKKFFDDVRIEKKKVGLSANTPSSFRTDVERYLQWLEADKARFDAVAFKNASDLKALYYVAGKHALKHNERAQKVLWERDYPKDSPLNVFKLVTDAKTPEEAAKLIVEHKIPYNVAVGLVPKVTPSILVALINAMSPKELVNNIASLQERGALDNPELKKVIESKLEKAKKSKNMDALKSKTAKSTNRVTDESVLKKLDEIADVQVKKAGVIKVPTAIMVDKCVVGDTLVPTDMGLLFINTLVPKMYKNVKDISIDIGVAGRSGKNKAVRIYVNGRKPIKRLCTDKGYELGASNNHPILVYDPLSAALSWKEAAKVNIGDYVPLKRGTRCFGEDFSFSYYLQKDPYQPDEKLPTIPKRMSPKLAAWIGYLVSEGRNRVQNSRIEFSNCDAYLLEDFRKISKEVFGVNTEDIDRGVSIISASLFDFLINGIGLTRTRARECEVPQCILLSSEASQISFLRAYFSGDGGIMNRKSGVLAATSASKKLLSTIQGMLLNIGVVSKLSTYRSGATNASNIVRNYWRLCIGGMDASKFMFLIGFSSPYKNNECKNVVSTRSLTWSARWDSIPNLRTVVDGTSNCTAVCRKSFPTLACFSHSTKDSRIARDLLEKIIIVFPKFSTVGNIKEIVKEEFYIDRIKKISNSEEDVFDLNVPKGHSFISNGFVSHNSGSMTQAIETGKRAAALVSGVTTADLHVLAFDTMARRITATEKTLTAWENAFKPVHASGGTSMGAALDLLIREKVYVDQIVVITDEGENQTPFFADVYSRYATELDVRPRVIVINVNDAGRGADHTFSDNLKRAKIDYEIYKPEKFDYYGLPGLTLMLSRNTKLDLLYEIMAVPLKVRQPFRV